MATEQIEKGTLTVEEAATRLGLGRSLTYDLARSGELPGVRRLGGRYIISRRVLEDYLSGKVEVSAD